MLNFRGGTLTAPASKTGPYIYDPVDVTRREIRLLIILPALNSSEPIDCIITTTSLSERLHFEALSYVWGHELDICPQPININGHHTFIRNNLMSALVAVRDQKNARKLWVDALCINQASVEERSEVVGKLMGAVYSVADCVIVWLGPASPDSDLAMNALIDFKTFKQSISHESLMPWQNAYNVPAALEALGHLFERTWFQRVWTIQEFALARKIVWRCGNRELDWTGVEKVLESMTKTYGGHGAHDDPGMILPNQDVTESDARAFSRLRNGDIWMRLHTDRKHPMAVQGSRYVETKSLLALLDSHMHLQATDPRDKIYSMLGLAQKHLIGFNKIGTDLTSPQEIRGKLDRMRAKVSGVRDEGPLRMNKRVPEINYTHNVIDVYKEWAQWIINEEDSLNIFASCQKSVRWPGLPSWVPSWHIKEEAEFTPVFKQAMLDFQATKYLHAPALSLDSLMTGAQNVLQIRSYLTMPVQGFRKWYYSLENHNLLCVRGIQLAQLGGGQFWPVPPDYENRLIQYLPEGYIAGLNEQSWAKLAGMATLYTAGAVGSGVWAVVGDGGNLAMKGASMNAKALAGLYGDRLSVRESKMAGRLQMLRSVLTTGRKYFGASMYHGLVPMAAQAGDVICLLMGLDTPYVLRPVGDNYELVGECFIEGCMRGEAVLRWQEMQVARHGRWQVEQLETFTLQ